MMGAITTATLKKIDRKGYSMAFAWEEGGGYHADVCLYGEVVETVPLDWFGEKVAGLFVELEGFMKDFDRLKAMDSVTFRINSVGGDVSAGTVIYNRIRELPGKTMTVVDGLAASAASVIMQAGDERVMNPGTQIMIHGASAFLFGYYNREGLQETDRALETINRSMAAIYQDRTGKSEKEILEAMEKTTWLTPEQAVEWGLADRAEAPGKARDEPRIAAYSKRLFVARGIPLPEGYAFKETGREERKSMDIETLKKEHPDIVEQIKAEAKAEAETAMKARAAEIEGRAEAKGKEEADAAVKAALEQERTRLKEIDAIAEAVGDKALVEKAKYDEPMTAERLALYAMKLQAKAGADYLAARDAAVAKSGAADVKPAPNGGEEKLEKSEEKAEAVNLLKNAWKGGR